MNYWLGSKLISKNVKVVISKAIIMKLFTDNLESYLAMGFMSKKGDNMVPGCFLQTRSVTQSKKIGFVQRGEAAGFES